MVSADIVQQIAIWAMPILLAITVHEATHGLVARRFGDNTAEMQGRLTLNPFRHIDPVGTLLVPCIMLITIGIPFGWAKPVPVDWRNFKRPRQDMAWVAVAGPLSNLAMAIGWALMMRLSLLLGLNSWVGKPLYYMSEAGIYINIILMVLNLLPLPPLDGGRVAVGILPPRPAFVFSRVEPYGIWILIALIILGVIGWVMAPIMNLFISILAPLAGVPLRNF